MYPFGKFSDSQFSRQGFDWTGERVRDKPFENVPRPCLSVNADPLLEPEFVQYMKSANMLHMEMTQEEIDGFVRIHIAIQFVNPVASVEDNVIFLCVNKHARRVAGFGVIPTIRPKKNHFHCRKPENRALILRCQ